MGSAFHEAPYPRLRVHDFGPSSRYRVAVQNGGRTIAIGDHTDVAFQRVHSWIQPGSGAIDVVVHGLPGRFIEKFGGTHEIPADVIAQLLDAGGIIRGTPLRLLTCHASELPRLGTTSAQMLATQWGGPILGPSGLLFISVGQLRVDLVDWDIDPVSGGMVPNPAGRGLGNWVISVP